MSDYIFRIATLTDQFYQAYPNPPYKEIMDKTQRAYNCLLIQTHSNYFICLPYRSEIHHDNAYKFKKSIRSTHHTSGLDYTKTVIIQNTNYISSSPAFIDNDEYTETVKNIKRIIRDSTNYIDNYIFHCNQTHILHPREFSRKYQFTTLKYFHKELGLEDCS